MNYVGRVIMSNNLHFQLNFLTCLVNARPSCLSFIGFVSYCKKNFFQLQFTQTPTYHFLSVWFYCIAAVLCLKPTLNPVLRAEIKRTSYAERTPFSIVTEVWPNVEKNDGFREALRKHLKCPRGPPGAPGPLLDKPCIMYGARVHQVPVEGARCEICSHSS